MSPFSLSGPDLARWFHEMRAQSPVYHDPDFSFFFGASGGWQFFRYDDVKQAFSDYETYSSEFIPATTEDYLGASMLTSDPPRQRTLRALVTKAFSPAVIIPLEQWIYDRCEQLLQPLLQQGSMEFMQDYATPLPHLVIARLIGIPENRGADVTRWSKTMTGDPAILGMDVYYNTMSEMGSFLTEMLEARRQMPQEDLMTQLLQTTVDGEQLSMKEIIACCISLISAGTETTEAWLTIAMYLFIQYPHLQDHLRATPDDLPNALLEVLRFRCPVLGMPRIANRDVEVRGQQIRKGEMVNLCIAAANLDPEVFPNPDHFDIHRDNSKILSFGYGIHFCVGSLLARLETRIAFEVLFRHTRQIRLLTDAVPVRHPSSMVYSYQSLPLIIDL